MPKVVERSHIHAIASGIELPLNVLAWPELPAVSELFQLGVRRPSAGCALSQLAFGRAAAAASAFIRGAYSELSTDATIPFAGMNPLFSLVLT